jgi:hypothetical protein
LSTKGSLRPGERGARYMRKPIYQSFDAGFAER